MSNRPGLFAAPRHTVLSLNVQAEFASRERDRSQFEVLVRHLIYRFFHNELLASDDETKCVMLVSYTAALPSFVLTLFLYPLYHFAIPPMPYPRPFWSQIGDHYFFAMYSFLIMGAAAVYEWDLLFPDLLDVFVLSVLPISTRRLFFARVLALTIFLGLVLIGTSILGTLFFPAVANLPRFGTHLLAHALSVLMSGTFAAASFLALQGILLNTVGQHVFRRITPFLQGCSTMLLLAVLLFYPAVCHSIMPLLTSDSTAVRCFPPFWFLGVYERILQGPSALPIFSHLARTAYIALLVMVSIVLLTYPLAYRRRVRQLIEGAGVIDNPSRAAAPLRHVLHTVVLRHPAQRAVFHFVSQTILRAQRQRVMLGLYGGLALAITISNMVVLHIAAGHLRPSLLPYGIRTAVPIMAFWHHRCTRLHRLRAHRPALLMALPRHHRKTRPGSLGRNPNLDHAVGHAHQHHNSPGSPCPIARRTADTSHHRRTSTGRHRHFAVAYRLMPVPRPHHSLHPPAYQLHFGFPAYGGALLRPLPILCLHRRPPGEMD